MFICLYLIFVLFAYLATLFYDFQTWEGLFEGIWKLCKRSLQGDQIQGTKIQGSAWMTACRPADKRTAAGRGASLDLGALDLIFGEAALAADLITASISLRVFLPPTAF